MKDLYLSRSLRTIIASKAKGLIVSKKNRDDLKFIFGSSIRYYLHVRLITFIPIAIAKIVYTVGRKLRRLKF